MASLPSLDEALGMVPAERLDKKCSSDHLNTLSRSLTQWRLVRPFLELTEAEEEEIIYGQDLRKQRVDVLMRWKENQRDKATYRALIVALYRAERMDLVDLVIELLLSPISSQSTPLSSPSHSPQLPSLPAHRFTVVDYGKFLKEMYTYKDDAPTPTVQWPPVPIQKVFKLAMIRQTKIQRGEVRDDYVRLTITGKVDDILHMKTPVRLEDIFKIDSKNRKVILIEGAPGSGKSTLCWDICKRWGAGELFQDYDAVILVQLRDPKVQAASKIADILPGRDRAMADSVAEQIEACRGLKVLFILDGWDELPLSLQKVSIFRDLIGSQLLDDSYDKSTVIVTSRPISSGELHPLVSSRVEIVGFTPEELRQFFSECLSGDPQAVRTLLERVEENPMVASSCYLPLNAAIIVHLFLSGNEELPTTTHGIFTSLVLCCLARYLRERLGLKGEEANLDYLDNLPKNLQQPFRQLCALAFSGVMQNTITFGSADLEELGISTEVSALGLLQVVPSIVSHKVSVYYNFLHLLIQELLAAYYISFLHGRKQISYFQKFFHEARFAAVFQFYAGITRFQSERKYLCKLAFLLPRRLVPTGIRDVIISMLQQRQNKPLLLALIHCLYEADDPVLNEFVASKLCLSESLKVFNTYTGEEEYDLDLAETTLSPLDCLSVGYFLPSVCANAAGECTINLSNCSMGDQGCKFLIKGLSRQLISGALKATAPLRINLVSNNIHEEGAQHIAQLVKSGNTVQELDLAVNKIGASGFMVIAQALVTNSSVVRLYLSNCSIEITEENGPVLRELLQRNNILEALDLSHNRQLSDTGVRFIAEGLMQNTSLRKLYLCYCGISDEGVKSISNVLLVNQSLKELRLWGNHRMTAMGLSVLMETLQSNSGLVKLWLPKRFKAVDVRSKNSSVMVNVMRRINKKPLIDVDYINDDEV